MPSGCFFAVDGVAQDACFGHDADKPSSLQFGQTANLSKITVGAYQFPALEGSGNLLPSIVFKIDIKLA